MSTSRLYIVARDLELGRIQPVVPSWPTISSPQGLVPKPNGKWRRITDFSFPKGKSVNSYITEEAAYLRFGAFEEILQSVLAAGRGCVIMKRDWKDAFRLIPIAPHEYWKTRFEWLGTFYQDRCCSFGGSTFPCIFNFLGEGFEWILKSWFQWLLCHHYLDDNIVIFKIFASLPADLEKYRLEYKLIARILGIWENEDKDEIGTDIPLLGRQVNTNTFTVSVPPDKQARILHLTTVVLARKKPGKGAWITRAELESLVGLLSFCASCVQLGWLFCRRLWNFIGFFDSTWKSDTKTRVPREVYDDIKWWNELFPSYNGVRFSDDSSRNVIHLFCDAGGAGRGGFFIKYADDNKSLDCDWLAHAGSLSADQAFAELVPPSTGTFDINIEEINAVLSSLRRWGSSWRSHIVVVHTDNTTTEIGLLKQRLKNPDQNEGIRKIVLLAAHLDIKLETVRITTDDNGLADALSRDQQDRIADWCPQWPPFIHSLTHRSHGHA
jgi:hypothetical protein